MNPLSRSIPRRDTYQEQKPVVSNKGGELAPTSKPEFKIKLVVHVSSGGIRPLRFPVIANDMKEAIKRAVKIGMTITGAYRAEIKECLIKA